MALNTNEDKGKAIRDKILCLYFVGEFDVSQFASMPVSVVPEVMSQIEGDGKQSAMYRLLKCLPELRNVGERKSIEQTGHKRQKIGSV